MSNEALARRAPHVAAPSPARAARARVARAPWARATSSTLARSLALALSLGLGLGALGACKKGDGGAGQQKKGPPSFPVEVRPAEVKRVEYRVTAVGTIDAFEEVQITARVAGVVEEVRFKEGEHVKKGDVLATIEPGRYQLSASAARARLDKVAAAKADAESTLARREKMKVEGLATAEDLQGVRTRSMSASADLAEARSSLSLAELNLRDAIVRAPFDGTIQQRVVRTGSYAQPGTLLATMVRVDPLLLRFQVAEEEVARIQPGMTVRYRAAGEAELGTAKVTHVAALANPKNRMVSIVAEIDAPARGKPGGFADVIVPVGSADRAVVIPQIAVRPSDRGFLAFVVRDGKAEERVLELGLRTEGGLVEVKKGLAEGESVVVRGAEALRPGVAVRVAAPNASATASSGPAPAPSPTVSQGATPSAPAGPSASPSTTPSVSPSTTASTTASASATPTSSAAATARPSAPKPESKGSATGSRGAP